MIKLVKYELVLICFLSGMDKCSCVCERERIREEWKDKILSFPVFPENLKQARTTEKNSKQEMHP